MRSISARPAVHRPPHERLVVVKRLDLAQRAHALALDHDHPGRRRLGAPGRRRPAGRAAGRRARRWRQAGAGRSRSRARAARAVICRGQSYAARARAAHILTAPCRTCSSRRRPAVDVAVIGGGRHGLRGGPAPGPGRSRGHRHRARHPGRRGLQRRRRHPGPAVGVARGRARCSSWGCRAGPSTPPSPPSCTSCRGSTSATPARASSSWRSTEPRTRSRWPRARPGSAARGLSAELAAARGAARARAAPGPRRPGGAALSRRGARARPGAGPRAVAGGGPGRAPASCRAATCAGCLSRAAAPGASSSTARRLAASMVVLCAGSWSSLVEAGGVPAPVVRPARGQMVAIETRPPLFRHVLVAHGRGYLVPRADGVALAGSTLEMVGFRKEVTVAGLCDILTLARTLVPDLGEAPVTETWSNFRPYTPDALPVIGRTPVEGLLVATGHHRYGILLTPITAQVIAELVTRGTSSVDLGPVLRHPVRVSGLAGRRPHTLASAGHDVASIRARSRSPLRWPGRRGLARSRRRPRPPAPPPTAPGARAGRGGGGAGGDRRGQRRQRPGARAGRRLSPAGRAGLRRPGRRDRRRARSRPRWPPCGRPGSPAPSGSCAATACSSRASWTGTSGCGSRPSWTPPTCGASSIARAARPTGGSRPGSSRWWAAGPPEAAAALASALAGEGVRAQHQPGAPTDEAGLRALAARSGRGVAVLVTGRAASEGLVRGTSEQAVECHLGVRLVGADGSTKGSRARRRQPGLRRRRARGPGELLRPGLARAAARVLPDLGVGAGGQRRPAGGDARPRHQRAGGDLAGAAGPAQDRRARRGRGAPGRGRAGRDPRAQPAGAVGARSARLTRELASVATVTRTGQGAGDRLEAQVRLMAVTAPAGPRRGPGPRLPASRRQEGPAARWPASAAGRRCALALGWAAVAGCAMTGPRPGDPARPLQRPGGDAVDR